MSDGRRVVAFVSARGGQPGRWVVSTFEAVLLFIRQVITYHWILSISFGGDDRFEFDVLGTSESAHVSPSGGRLSPAVSVVEAR